MRTIFERRASTILFRLAVAMPDDGGVFLLPANVCPVVPLALLAAERKFEFIDLDPGTLCMDEAIVRHRIVAEGKPKVSGVIFVRTYGIEHESIDIFHHLRELNPGMLIIDDRCVCRPEPDATVFPNEGADVLLFSTGSSKQVDLGIGGFAHLPDELPYADGIHREYSPKDLQSMTTLYKKHIREGTTLSHPNDPPPLRRRLSLSRWLANDPPEIPWHAYVDDLLTHRDRLEARRAEINAVFCRRIPEEFQLPAGFHNWRFQIRVADGEKLADKIFAAGFFAGRHYFPSSLLFGDSSCPIASDLHAEIVNLFNDDHITLGDAEKIALIVIGHIS